jgi:ADP-ribose pyrophosphatase
MSTPPSDQHLVEIELSDDTIYEGRIVNLHLKRVQLPNGEESKREIIQHHGAVAMVALFPDGQVILVRQYRTAAGRVLLEIPAGTLEPNEAPQDAAIRELREETGYRPESIKHMGGIFAAPGYTTEYIHLYLATDLVHDPLQTDRDEFIDTLQIPLAEAIQKIVAGEIEDGKTVSGLLLAAQHYQA